MVSVCIKLLKARGEREMEEGDLFKNSFWYLYEFYYFFKSLKKHLSKPN